MKPEVRVICLLLSLACLPVSAVGAGSPNIVLITLDTTRADRMGFLGSTRRLTPNLDLLARQSVVFTHAYAQAPLTSVSHATILTGTYPQFHGVVDFPMVLAGDLPYAPEILRNHGYHTAAFVGALVLDPKGGAPGFDRGFDTYDANFSPEDFQTRGRYQSLERRGEEVVAHAIKWLKQRPQGPFFLWLHLYDPHEPYDPPEPYKTLFAAEPYDGEIAYDDAVIGKLITELKSQSLYERALITVTADHGESLGAHGEDTHGVFVYDETIQVPLLVKLPRAIASTVTARKNSGRTPKTVSKIDSRVELVDVMPTLLEAANIAVPQEVQGESLLGLMKTAGADIPQSWRDRPAYAEAVYASLAYGWSPLRSLRTGKYLYIQAPHRELYDLSADPKAEHNLASESKAVADTLAAQLDSFRQKTSSSRQAPKADLDPARMKQLAALGYVVSARTAAMAGASEQGADPKDRIQLVTTIRHLESLMWDKRYDEAIPVLQQLATQFPDMAPVPLKLAECYLALRQDDNAVAALRKAVALNPDSTVAQIELGRTLMGIGNFSEAATIFENLTDKTPKLLEAQILLAVTYARANRVPETIKQCNRVLGLAPDHFGTTMILAQFLAKSGDNQGAIERLAKAATLRPQSPEPHRLLAEIYDQLGRKGDAAREREEAGRLAASAN
jgi:arylsulfatase A-like enzyme/Flp pilus assembly protein TadD